MNATSNEEVVQLTISLDQFNRQEGLFLTWDRRRSGFVTLRQETTREIRSLTLSFKELDGLSEAIARLGHQELLAREEQLMAAGLLSIEECQSDELRAAFDAACKEHVKAA